MQNLSRAEAIERGLTRYFTGKECKRGHISERMVSTKTCVFCKAENEKNRPKRELTEQQIERRRHRQKNNYHAKINEKRAYYARWRKANKGKAMAAKLKWQKKKRDEDPAFALKHRVSCLIRQALKHRGSEKKGPTSEILGCSTIEFKKYIERQFTKGMNWENMGEWHIDHIVPISSAETEQDVYALNHYTNLRPLWASDNLRKSNKMEYLI